MDRGANEVYWACLLAAFALSAFLRSLASLLRAVCGQDVSGFSLAGMGQGAPGRP